MVTVVSEYNKKGRKPAAATSVLWKIIIPCLMEFTISIIALTRLWERERERG